MNYKTEQLTAMADLFKVLPEFDRGSGATRSISDCTKHGFFVVDTHDNVCREISYTEYSILNSLYGIEAAKMNNTFHKSFATVENADMDTLIAQQLMNYFSTYGLESLGLKAQNWVPVEKLELPEGMLPVSKIVVIRRATDNEIVELINDFLAMTKAPSARIITCMKELLPLATIDADEILSFELQVLAHELNGTIPSDPTTFLRYVIYELTGSTMLIKNRASINSIKSALKWNDGKVRLVEDAFAKADETRLASIFLRMKPLFLAFKADKKLSPTINRIRRYADEYHEPLSDFNLRNATSYARQGKLDEFTRLVTKASNRNLFKLWPALVANGEAPRIFSVRNGKSFVAPAGEAVPKDAAMIVAQMLRNRYDWRDKVFVIPDYIDYACPTSEKQFTGNIPWGTRLACPNDAFTVGIHWVNGKQNGYERRTDIDLHLNGVNHSYGWCYGYRDNGVIFTGDQTDAPGPIGAAEAYYFEPGDESFVLNASLFSGMENQPFKLFMTSVKPEVKHRNYTFDPKESLFTPIPLKFNKTNGRNMTIGMFADGQFYFYGGRLEDGIVPHANYADFIEGMKAKMKGTCTIKELIQLVGGTVVSDIKDVAEDMVDSVIDLRPESLTATTLLELIDNK